MIYKASSLLKETTIAFSFDIERLKKLKHARNRELRSNSYTKKVPLAKRPMVSFFKLLEVHNPFLGVDKYMKNKCSTCNLQ
jgi:hypothetical protein